MNRWTAAALAACALAALGGCASMAGKTEQLVEVHTILDHREIAGAGCVLSNEAGRWFVNAPGRVRIQKSEGKLTVHCKRHGVAEGAEAVASRFDAGSLLGNVVVSGGLGYLVDRKTGAGFDYPPVLTVIMKPTAAQAQASQGASGGNAIY
ncbi:hypothetical protein [Massilia glaciei]|uniref:hypothetical protein n=1 Tax=Massilia glaciei TaxID=1524097 RepID=UPI00351D1F8A